MQRKSLVDILHASGLQDSDEAAKLASVRTPGVSWTVEVLDSGKVDEIKFTEQLGVLFKTPVESLTLRGLIVRRLVRSPVALSSNTTFCRFRQMRGF